MASEQWAFDSGHSGIYFSVRHMMLARVRGQFTRWSGALVVTDGDSQGASISVLIDASSLATGLEERDAHLKSADLLNTAAFPEWTFLGQGRPLSRGRGYRITGDLAALGRTHRISFKAEGRGTILDPWGHQRAGFTARGSLPLQQLGLLWNQSLGPGGFLLGSGVDFELEVEAVLQAPRVE